MRGFSPLKQIHSCTSVNWIHKATQRSFLAQLGGVVCLTVLQRHRRTVGINKHTVLSLIGWRWLRCWYICQDYSLNKCVMGDKTQLRFQFKLRTLDQWCQNRGDQNRPSKDFKPADWTALEKCTDFELLAVFSDVLQLFLLIKIHLPPLTFTLHVAYSVRRVRCPCSRCKLDVCRLDQCNYTSDVCVLTSDHFQKVISSVQK